MNRTPEPPDTLAGLNWAVQALLNEMSFRIDKDCTSKDHERLDSIATLAARLGVLNLPPRPTKNPLPAREAWVYLEAVLAAAPELPGGPVDEFDAQEQGAESLLLKSRGLRQRFPNMRYVEVTGDGRNSDVVMAGLNAMLGDGELQILSTQDGTQCLFSEHIDEALVAFNAFREEFTHYFKAHYWRRQDVEFPNTAGTGGELVWFDWMIRLLPALAASAEQIHQDHGIDLQWVPPEVHAGVPVVVDGGRGLRFPGDLTTGPLPSAEAWAKLVGACDAGSVAFRYPALSVFEFLETVCDLLAWKARGVSAIVAQAREEQLTGPAVIADLDQFAWALRTIAEKLNVNLLDQRVNGDGVSDVTDALEDLRLLKIRVARAELAAKTFSFSVRAPVIARLEDLFHEIHEAYMGTGVTFSFDGEVSDAMGFLDSVYARLYARHFDELGNLAVQVSIAHHEQTEPQQPEPLPVAAPAKGETALDVVKRLREEWRRKPKTSPPPRRGEAESPAPAPPPRDEDEPISPREQGEMIGWSSCTGVDELKLLGRIRKAAIKMGVELEEFRIEGKGNKTFVRKGQWRNLANCLHLMIPSGTSPAAAVTKIEKTLRVQNNVGGEVTYLCRECPEKFRTDAVLPACPKCGKHDKLTALTSPKAGK